MVLLNPPSLLSHPFSPSRPSSPQGRRARPLSVHTIPGTRRGLPHSRPTGPYGWCSHPLLPPAISTSSGWTDWHPSGVSTCLGSDLSAFSILWPQGLGQEWPHDSRWPTESLFWDLEEGTMRKEAALAARGPGWEGVSLKLTVGEPARERGQQGRQWR